MYMERAPSEKEKEKKKISNQWAVIRRFLGMLFCASESGLGGGPLALQTPKVISH
jgi:hypothetical protein